MANLGFYCAGVISSVLRAQDFVAQGKLLLHLYYK